jgi:hypothetical protein
VAQLLGYGVTSEAQPDLLQSSSLNFLPSSLPSEDVALALDPLGDVVAGWTPASGQPLFKLRPFGAIDMT